MLCHPCILGGPQRQVWGKTHKRPTGGHIANMHAFSLKLYCLWQGTSKKGDKRTFLRCRGYKTT